MTSTLPVQPHLEQYRQQFPALSNKAYFNYGGQGPMPQVALEAMQQAQLYMQEAGPFSGSVNRWIQTESQQTRQAIATELGVTPDTITLTDSVSTGCNIALWGLDWQAGDRILITDCEHQGVVAAVQELQRRFGVAIDVCPWLNAAPGSDFVAAIAEHLTPNTRLVVLSHILWNTGQVLPLAEVAQVCHQYPTHRYPVRVLVDAAQSVGVLPLNLSEIKADFYAFTGHKWWCGPAGVGGLYVDPDALAELQPTFIGWRSVTVNMAGQPTGWEAGGKRFEVATSAFPLYAGLRAAIAIHHEWGPIATRYERIQQLSHYLWEQLAAIPAVRRVQLTAPDAGLVAWQVPGRSHRQLVEFLENQQLIVRTLLSPDCVRACVHYFTLESEIDRLVAGIAAFCQTESV